MTLFVAQSVTQQTRLNPGGDKIIFEPHRKELSHALTHLQAKGTSSLSFGKRGLTATWKGQTVTCSDDSVLKRDLKVIQRIFQYYQNIERGQGVVLNSGQQGSRTRIMSQLVKGMQTEAIPGTNGQVWAGIQVTDKTLSIVRNSLAQIPSIGERDPFVNHLGFHAAMIWTLVGFHEISQGKVEYEQSKSMGDREGMRRGKVLALSGGIVSAGSVSYIGAKCLEKLSTSLPATAAFGTSGVLFSAGAVLAIAVAGCGALRCHRFGKRLDQYFENKNLPKEVDQFRGAVQFLENELFGYSEEIHKLAEEINKKLLSKKEQESLFRIELAKMQGTNMRRMKRRTSLESVVRIRRDAGTILQMLNAPKNSARFKQGIEKARELVNFVRAENRAKKLLYVLGGIVSILSLVATILTTFLSGGTFPALLFVISGMLSVSMSIYVFAVPRLRNCRNPQPPVLEMQNPLLQHRRKVATVRG